MPRPKSKKELLDLSQTSYFKLTGFIDPSSEVERLTEFLKGYLNRNSTDVLAHLQQWDLMFMDWYAIGMAEKKPDIPAKGYTWKTSPDLNRKIQEKYRD